jgi:hypothetical protein
MAVTVEEVGAEKHTLSGEELASETDPLPPPTGSRIISDSDDSSRSSPEDTKSTTSIVLKIAS